MNETDVVIITKSEDLPQMRCTNFFHSTDLFRVLENTPEQKPYMIVAYNKGSIIAHMLVMLRRRSSLFPPYLFTQGRVYGEGEFDCDCDKEEVFGLMLHKIVKKLQRGLCLYIEFSELSSKMFGYGKFRANGFFPVHWMEIHNSLHSMNPARRLTPRMKRLIINAKASGFRSGLIKTADEFESFFKIMKNRTTIKIRRYIPDPSLFRKTMAEGRCNIFTTWHKNVMTGGCVCVYSNGNCHLWYLASKRKLHKKRSDALTVWTAIQHAYNNKSDHIYFMDVGLPYKKNLLREFILGFGGKPVGTYRWFRCSITWINSLLSWFYRE